ncbi:hypothetical protein LY76DRAFT_599698, partial [Colletotrichum caudatum]
VAVNLARALNSFARQQPCWPWPDIQKSAGWACPSPSIPSIFTLTIRITSLNP